jgi:hypothetical protein
METSTHVTPGAKLALDPVPFLGLARRPLLLASFWLAVFVALFALVGGVGASDVVSAIGSGSVARWFDESTVTDDNDAPLPEDEMPAVNASLSDDDAPSANDASP